MVMAPPEEIFTALRLTSHVAFSRMMVKPSVVLLTVGAPLKSVEAKSPESEIVLDNVWPKAGV